MKLHFSKMEITSNKCSCGNIILKGLLVPLFFQFNVDKNGLQFCNTLYLIKSQTIELQNSNNLKICSHKNAPSDIFCFRCGTIFRAVIGESKLYLEKKQIVHLSTDKMNKYQNSHNNSYINKKFHITSITNILKPLKKQKIQIKEQLNADKNSINQHSFDEYDTDFELMFSNKYEPFVGSFKNQIINNPYDY